MNDAVALHVDERIAWITFNRPEQRNALTVSMYERMAELCRTVNSDAGVRVVVFIGAGGSFVAGMDIAELQELPRQADPLEYSRRMDAVFDAVEHLRMPSIAAIDGAAVGAGAALAACCDLRVGSASARFGFPIARTVGNALSPRILARLVSLVGVARVKQMLYAADLVDARQMLQVGLLAELFDDGVFEERVRDYAERIASNAPLTIRATKDVLLRIQQVMTPSDALDSVAAAYMSEDFREGVNAYLEKRKPAWRGE